MAEVSISAEPRTEFGKGGARRTRRAGKVPAVLYGHGTDPRHIAFGARDFAHALKTGGGANVLLRLDLDGGSELALPKGIQRDPLRGTVEHVDLILVRRGEKVTVEIPDLLTGEAARDGMIDHQLTTLSIEAEATHIPQSLEIDIDGMAVGDAVHAGEVKLPEGSVLHTDAEAIVVHVLAAPTEEELEAELAEAEADLGAGAAGAAALAAAEEAEAAEEPPTGEGDEVPDATGTGGAVADADEG